MENTTKTICRKPRDQADRLLKDARSAGDRRREGSALVDLGAADLHGGEPDRGLEGLEVALAIARELGDKTLENDALSDQSWLGAVGYRPT
jgi:hypothetical protein